MQTRQLGPFTVSAIGFGCMNVSHAYGDPAPYDVAASLFLEALDLGVTHLDTAALYGFGANEELVGKVLAPHRARFTLATKGGMYGIDGKRVIDGRPDTLVRQLENSLRRLQTDVVDLFYLHRWDKRVPIEDSVGAMAKLVGQGKVRALGLSEVSAQTLRRAHAVHPISAVQTEYSLWTRNPEIAVMDTCRELGTTVVAFSPLARGWLANPHLDLSLLEPHDLRKTMPRFQPEHFERNRPVLNQFVAIAREVGQSPAQLALGWVLSKYPHTLPIPGTQSIEHLRDNMAAVELRLPGGLMSRLDSLFTPGRISGARYGESAQSEVDTEEFSRH
ncbi:MAG: aldo/keto reductase [Proteobacteria bacterium]|nr:aldo/keto reductase [Pseudomonadota bacterium]